MKLKRLTLHGFKSFADRTDLDFGDGMTAVVGPNGCGKSNVVDSVKWVLGEQSAKSLRGQKMEDVIFNGSSNRKSMGLAEVSLAFETNGQLGDYGPEVVLTRRLYRSGQSEYLINNNVCRLRDIRDLFLDTGVGLDAYSLIEQGKVDLLLQASNQDRRAVLEEAAGISKYKVRRKEAQRRLENVTQNLLRAGDIVAEVEKHLRSVKLQAGKARNYQQYVTQLQELKSKYYLAEYHNLMDEQGRLRVELDRYHEELKRLKTNHELLDARRSQFDLEIVELTNQISQIENQLTQTTGQIDSGQQTIRLLNQRMEEQNDNLNRTRKRLHSQYLQIDRIRSEQLRVGEQLESLKKEELELQQQIGQVQQQLHERELKIAEIAHNLETEKSNLIELMRQTAKFNNQINQFELEQRNIVSQKERLTSRRQHLADERGKVQSDRIDRQRALDRIDQQIDAMDAENTGVQTRYQSLLQQADELSRTLADKKAQRAALASRYDVLADMQAQLQGVGGGAKKLLKLKEQSDPAANGLVGLVADLLATDLDHARLVEAALAGKDQYLVVEHSDFIERNRDLLAGLTGAVDIFALDLLPPVMNVRDFSPLEGVTGLAADLVKTDDRYSHLVRMLLGKTLIVENLSAALRLHKEDTAGWRFITPDGQLVENDGSIRVGSSKSGAGLIWRKSELEHLERQLAELDNEIGELTGQAKQVSEDQRATEQRLSELRSALYELRTRRIREHTALVSLDEQWHKLAKEEPIIDAELDSLDKQASFNAERHAHVQQQLAQIEAEQETLQRRTAELQQIYQSEQSGRETLNQQLTELKVSAGRLAQQRQALTDRANTLRQDYHQVIAGYESAQSEIESAKLRIEQAERQILQTESRLTQHFLAKQEHQRESAQLRQQRQGKNVQLQQLQVRAQELRSKIVEEQERSQDLAMKINELTVRQETLIQRVQEELQIDLEHAHADHQPDQVDWPALEAEINDLKGKIARLGNVNLDAIAEQEQLEARHVFLTSQREDLEEAQKKLNELILRLDEESRQRFMETFETVRANFQELFRKLFGGGKADLVLDNPEDVLESGIDILARPPGKETRSVSLLSGGEKTMTTVALLMAIFKSKPSPFCILDEVDAALDDANVDRYSRVLAEFQEHSQFIVITHNKRTMSYANVLYGITMQEAGISRKVAVRFDKNEPTDADKDEVEAA